MDVTENHWCMEPAGNAFDASWIPQSKHTHWAKKASMGGGSAESGDSTDFLTLADSPHLNDYK